MVLSIGQRTRGSAIISALNSRFRSTSLSNHSGQDPRPKKKRRKRKSIDERRLFTIHILNRDELKSLAYVNIDEQLLTGDIDEDIVILDLQL